MARENFADRSAILIAALFRLTTFVQCEANGWIEPSLTDAAICTKAALRR